jgi:branched-chain amino acid transport system substrate-binding protein
MNDRHATTPDSRESSATQWGGYPVTACASTSEQAALSTPVGESRPRTSGASAGGRASVVRRARVGVVVAVASAMLAACSSSSSAKVTSTTAGAATGGSSTTSSPAYPAIPAGPITFGVSASLSGPIAAYGITTKLAEEKVTLPAFNALFPNGIDGHPVKIEVLDDASDVTKAVNVATQMAADHVAGVLTVTYNPEGAAQQYAILNRDKVPVISVLDGSQYSDTTAWPYDFATGPSYAQTATASAQWIAKHGYTRVALLSDGVAQDTDVENQITSAIKADAPQAQIVKSVTISPGSVDVSAAIAQLKASNPDLLIVLNGFGYGPIWSAMQAVGWSPEILASPGAWYDGFTAMAPLVSKAVSPFYGCADSPTQTWPAGVASLMSQYAAITKDASINYLDFVQTGIVPLEMFKYAIEKYHSVDPNAIKSALESTNGMSFEGLTYNFTSTNHYGLTGQYGAAVCNMGKPYAGGDANVPVKAS